MEKASYMNMQYLLLKESVFSHLFNICMEMASVMDLLSYFATGDYNNCCIHTTHTKQKTCTVFLSNYRNMSESLGEHQNTVCGNTSCRRVLISTAFLSSPKLSPDNQCFYNSIETRRTCFLFLLENTTTSKGKQLFNFDYQVANSLFSCHHCVKSLCQFCVFTELKKHNFKPINTCIFLDFFLIWLQQFADSMQTSHTFLLRFLKWNFFCSG